MHASNKLTYSRCHLHTRTIYFDVTLLRYINQLFYFLINIRFRWKNVHSFLTVIFVSCQYTVILHTHAFAITVSHVTSVTLVYYCGPDDGVD